MGLLKDNPVTDTLTGIFQVFGYPIALSAVFCFLTGIPFITFWEIVFKVLSDYFQMLWRIVSDPNFMNYVHQFFRKLIFMI